MNNLSEKIFRFIATAGYAGYIPFAPGTMGTLVALVLYVILGYLTKDLSGYYQVNSLIFIISLISFYPSVWISGWMEKETGKEDPGIIVIDEVLGYWVTVAFLPFNWKTVIIGFFLFRILDIVKPFPANSSQSLKNGWGVVVDDIIAGVYANILIRIMYSYDLFNLVFNG